MLPNFGDVNKWLAGCLKMIWTWLFFLLPVLYKLLMLRWCTDHTHTQALARRWMISILIQGTKCCLMLIVSKYKFSQLYIWKSNNLCIAYNHMPSICLTINNDLCFLWNLFLYCTALHWYKASHHIVLPLHSPTYEIIHHELLRICLAYYINKNVAFCLYIFLK